MNHRQIIINSTQKSLTHELNLRMTNVMSINPKISNDMDGIVKNFCKMTRLIWHNYATEKSGFAKDDFDSINDSNINDIKDVKDEVFENLEVKINRLIEKDKNYCLKKDTKNEILFVKEAFKAINP